MLRNRVNPRAPVRQVRFGVVYFAFSYSWFLMLHGTVCPDGIGRHRHRGERTSSGARVRRYSSQTNWSVDGAQMSSPQSASSTACWMPKEVITTTATAMIPPSRNTTYDGRPVLWMSRRTSRWPVWPPTAPTAANQRNICQESLPMVRYFTVPPIAVKRIIKPVVAVPTCGWKSSATKMGPRIIPPPMPSSPAAAPAPTAAGTSIPADLRDQTMSPATGSMPASSMRAPSAMLRRAM
mmetsp:Transcript_14467/g.41533  ORF Transcript_14467/g.41533 Transcript_14467/m.41533 type:complete len:237 (+) Transcript_14467:112-822(+)